MKKFKVSSYDSQQEWVIPAESQAEIRAKAQELGITKFKIEPFVHGCECNGTGIDPGFGDPCKCVTEKEAEKPTDKQLVWISDLQAQIKQIMVLDLSWVTVNKKDEVNEMLDLLKGVKNLINMVRTNKTLLTQEQIEAIRAKINNKPTKQWVVAAQRKMAVLIKDSKQDS